VKSNKLISRKKYFEYFLSKLKILLTENGKYPEKKYREIDSFHLTSFLAWTFLTFLAHCELYKKIWSNLKITQGRISNL